MASQEEPLLARSAMSFYSIFQQNDFAALAGMPRSGALDHQDSRVSAEVLASAAFARDEIRSEKERKINLTVV